MRWLLLAALSLSCLVLAALSVACSAPRFGALVLEQQLGWRGETFDQLDALLVNAERTTAIPGGQLAVFAQGHLVYQHHFGGDGPFRRERFDDATLFDAASLAKPLVGAAAVARARAEGRLDDARWQTALLLLQHRAGIHDESAYPRVMEDIGALTAVLDGVRDSGEDCYSNAGYAALAVLLDERRREPVPRGQVAFTGWRRSGAPIRGTPYDPLAEKMLAESDLLPLHSGHFTTASVAAMEIGAVLAGESPVQRLHRALLVGGVTAAPSCIGGEPLHRSAGGLESMAAPPWAREGAPHGRWFLQDGYTGCFLWMDARNSTVAVLLTNAISTDSFDQARRLMGSVVTLIREASP